MLFKLLIFEKQYWQLIRKTLVMWTPTALLYKKSTFITDISDKAILNILI